MEGERMNELTKTKYTKKEIETQQNTYKHRFFG